MRKTLNINLGGIAFIIDENAFELLHNYLEALKQKFNNEAERAEIMNDIEARIAELLNQRLQNRKEVLSIDDVQFVTDAMGKPEDIAGEEAETTTGGSAQNTSFASSTTSGVSTLGAPVKKRLFRDPDDSKIGGVISGLCHYFGIADPVWIRIIALILIFPTSGTIILIYLLLLVIVPKAQTAAEKLQMKGEPVNINTIEKEIKEAASRAGESVQNFVKEQNVFERTGDAAVGVLKVFLKLFAVLDIFVSTICLMAVLGCFVAFYVLGSTPYNAAAHLVVDSISVVRLFSFGFLLFVATPFIALIYLGLKILLGQRSRVRWLKWGLLAAWFIGLVLLTVSGIEIGENFSASGTKKVDTILMQPAHGTLLVQLTDSTGKKVSKDWEDDDNYNFNVHGRLMMNGVDFDEIGLLPIGKPSLQIMASESDSFYIQEVITSQGKDKNDAVKNAEMVIYQYSQTDTVLNLNAGVYMNKASKYRGQRVKLRIAIPRGKQIHFADNIDLWAATVKGDSNYDDTEFANTTWTVEGEKVRCIQGENHKNSDQEEMQKSDKLEKKIKQVEEKLDKLDKKDGDTDKNKTDNEDKDGDKDF